MAILKDSLDYLKTRNLTIDPMTEKTYDYYKEIVRVHDSHRMAVALPVQLFFQLMAHFDDLLFHIVPRF